MYINIHFQTHSSLFVRFRIKLFVLMFKHKIGKWHKLNGNESINSLIAIDKEIPSL